MIIMISIIKILAQPVILAGAKGIIREEDVLDQSLSRLVFRCIIRNPCCTVILNIFNLLLFFRDSKIIKYI